MASQKRSTDDLLDPASGDISPEDLQRLSAGLIRLLDVTGVLAAEVDPDKILKTITVEACIALDCERASVFQYDPDSDELYTSVVSELEISEIRHGLDQGVTGHAARHREMVNIPDASADPRWSATVDHQTGFVTHNILAIPLVAPRDDTLLGVLQFLNNEGGPFDQIDQKLALAFSQHAAVAIDRARLVEEIRSQQSTKASLEVARPIQRDFMPNELPAIPGYEAATWWFANEAIGGDYCDVVPLKDGRIGLIAADVSGHGLGPSLIMASLRAALRAMVLEHSAPEVLLNLLGRSLSSDLQEGRFITMVMAALDPRDHSLEYANAGHAPALYYEAASGDFQDLESTGMPLGVLARPSYPQGWPIELAVGDIVFLCTDGIVEAMDTKGKQFGIKRLQELIRRLAGRPVQEMVQQIGQEVSAHFEGDTPSDDLTILAVRRNR